MRPMLAGLILVCGLTGMADLALASVYGPGRAYVPGHIRDGVYIRPHFVSTPKLDPKLWPTDPGPIDAKPEALPPLLDLTPPASDGLGKPS